MPAGTAVRFEPGQEREVELVRYGGERRVYGFTGRVMGEPRRRRHDDASIDKPTPRCTGPPSAIASASPTPSSVIEVEEDRTIYGEEVKFGGGKVIRDGMGQSQREQRRSRSTRSSPTRSSSITGASSRPTSASRHGRIARIGKAGNPDVQPNVNIVIGPGTEVIAGEGLDRGAGRHRRAHPFHLPAADRRRADERRHHHDRRRHRTRRGHQRDDVHARPLAHRAHAAGGRRAADEPRLSRQGQREPAGRARRADRRRRDGPQAARGLGHDARRDRLLPRRRRALRRAGRDSHRHAERVGLRRGHVRRLQGPHHPRLSHRGRRRRPRARHHPRLRRAERPALVHESDAAVHGQHDRRASRHADGVPSPRSEHPGRRGVRRIAHPARDDRRRRHPARSRRVQHDLVRFAGDGPRRRGRDAHLADRAQDEGAARRRCAEDTRRARQLPRAALRRQVHDQPRDRARHRRPRSARSSRASSPTSCSRGRRSSA